MILPTLKQGQHIVYTRLKHASKQLMPSHIFFVGENGVVLKEYPAVGLPGPLLFTVWYIWLTEQQKQKLVMRQSMQLSCVQQLGDFVSPIP